jgi:Holliday junction resolvase
MRKAAKRDGNEGEIVKALRQQGASVVFLNMADAPDLLVGLGGITYLVEIKTPSGRLRSGQIRWHESWRGSPVAVVRSVEEALEVLKDANLRIPMPGLSGNTDCPAVISRGTAGRLPCMWW